MNRYTDDQLRIFRKLRSVLLCLTAHPDNEPHSEFADRIEDLEKIINFDLPKEFDKKEENQKLFDEDEN